MNRYCALFAIFIVYANLMAGNKSRQDEYCSYLKKNGITIEKYIVRKGIIKSVVSYDEGANMRDSVVIDGPDKYTIYTLDEYGRPRINTLLSLQSYPWIRYYLPNPFCRIKHFGVDLKQDVLSTFYLNIVETILMSADSYSTIIKNIGHHKTVCSLTDINLTYRHLPLFIEGYFYNQPIMCMPVVFSSGFLQDFTISFKTGILRCIFERKKKCLKGVQVVVDYQDGEKLSDKYVYVYDNI